MSTANPLHLENTVLGIRIQDLDLTVRAIQYCKDHNLRNLLQLLESGIHQWQREDETQSKIHRELYELMSTYTGNSTTFYEATQALDAGDPVQARALAMDLQAEGRFLLAARIYDRLGQSSTVRSCLFIHNHLEKVEQYRERTECFTHWIHDTTQYGLLDYKTAMGLVAPKLDEIYKELFPKSHQP